MNLKHNNVISTIRAIAMSMIMICHFCEYMNSKWTSFFNLGVQIFFCISGYLYGKKEICDELKFVLHSFKKILLSYYVYLFAILIIYAIFARDYLTFKSIIFALVGSGTLNGLGHLWFIPYILFCYLLTPFLFHIGKRFITRPTNQYVILCTIVLLLMQITIFSYFGYFKVAWIACYIVSYFISLRMQYVNQSMIPVMTRCFLCFSVILYSFHVYFNMNKIVINGMKTFFDLFYQYEHACFGITIFLCLYSFFSKIKGDFINKRFVLLEFTDTYSYDIFITHYLYILSPFTLMKLTNSSFLNITVIIIVTLMSALLLHKIVTIVDEKCCIPIWNKLNL